MQTDGVAFQQLSQHSDIADMNRIQANDIAAILRNYGVEVSEHRTLYAHIFSLVHSLTDSPNSLTQLSNYSSGRSQGNSKRNFGCVRSVRNCHQLPTLDSTCGK